MNKKELTFEFLDTIKDDYLRKLSNYKVSMTMNSIEECYSVDYWLFLKNKGINKRLPIFDSVNEEEFANYIIARFEDVSIKKVNYLEFCLKN